MGIALLLTTITTAFDIAFVLRLNQYLYINDYVFLFFTNLFEDFLSTRFIIIANGVINARITPNNIEASILAIFTGLGNLGFGLIGTLMGNFWGSYFRIDGNNLENLYLGLTVKLFCSLLPLLMLNLLPNKEEIAKDEDLKRLNN